MAETTGLLNRRTGHSVPRVRISSSPRNAISEADAARKCGVFAWKGVSESLLSSIPFHAKAEALQASPASADCSRTPRDVRRRPAPEQISSLLRHSFYLNARPHPTPPFRCHQSPIPPSTAQKSTIPCYQQRMIGANVTLLLFRLFDTYRPNSSRDKHERWSEND